MKHSLLITLLLAVSVAAHSQKVWAIGGFNSSNVHYKYEGDKVKTSSAIGLGIGAVSRIDILKAEQVTWTLDPQLMYAGKGQNKLSASRFRVHYAQLTLPVTVHIGHEKGGNYFLGLGPYFARALGGTYTTMYYDKEKLKIGNSNTDNIKGSDMGLSLTWGAVIKKARLQLQYDFGFANIYPGNNDASIRNRTFSFLFGFRIL